jgi:hypothetical protein
MSLRTSVSIEMSVGFNNALDDTAFERAKAELLDTCEAVKTATLTIPAAAVDQQIELDDVTETRLVYIEADGALDIMVNGPGTDPFRIEKMVVPTSTQAPNLCAYALLTLKASTIHVTNPSTDDAVRVKLCIVGNLTT